MTITLRSKTERGWTIDARFEIFKFPGGEPHIKDHFPEGDAHIRAQIAIVNQPTMEDLFTLALWADLVRDRNEEIWIALPYLPFARADRGHPFGAEVFAIFMNDTIEPDKIIALDPHSEVIEKFISNLTALDLPGIVSYATLGHKYDGIIAPDKGARLRATQVADRLLLPVFQAEKTRDFSSGALTGFHMVDKLPTKGNFLIVDDICDGGGTFVGLADAIKKENYGRNEISLDLWVSHGIFSKGFLDLQQRFDNIFTTNSWFAEDHDEDSFVHVTDLTTYISGAFDE